MEEVKPKEINGVVIEETLINSWPELFSQCWINIYPVREDILDASAELIMSDEYPEGTVVSSNKRYYPGCLAIISFQRTGEITFIWVKEEYREQGIGYMLGRWLRSYMANNFSIRTHHPFLSERNDIVEHLLNKFKNDYNAQDIMLMLDPPIETQIPDIINIEENAQIDGQESLF